MKTSILIFPVFLWTVVFASPTETDFINSMKWKVDSIQPVKTIYEEKLNFIIHGITNQTLDSYKSFEKKYGVGLIVKGCVVDPIALKKATENNRLVENYLNERYGSVWKQELPLKLLGID